VSARGPRALGSLALGHGRHILVASMGRGQPWLLDPMKLGRLGLLGRRREWRGAAESREPLLDIRTQPAVFDTRSQAWLLCTHGEREDLVRVSARGIERWSLGRGWAGAELSVGRHWLGISVDGRLALVDTRALPPGQRPLHDPRELQLQRRACDQAELGQGITRVLAIDDDNDNDNDDREPSLWLIESAGGLALTRRHFDSHGRLGPAQRICPLSRPPASVVSLAAPQRISAPPETPGTPDCKPGLRRLLLAFPQAAPDSDPSQGAPTTLRSLSLDARPDSAAALETYELPGGRSGSGRLLAAFADRGSSPWLWILRGQTLGLWSLHDLDRGPQGTWTLDLPGPIAACVATPGHPEAARDPGPPELAALLAGDDALAELTPLRPALGAAWRAVFGDLGSGRPDG